MGKSAVLGIFVALVFIGLLFFTVKTFAAMPTLQDLLALTPQPVLDFFHSLDRLNSGEASDAISQNLPVVGKPITNFLNIIWSVILVLLKGAGSVFVWIFHAIASGLESIIFSR